MVDLIDLCFINYKQMRKCKNEDSPEKPCSCNNLAFNFKCNVLAVPVNEKLQQQKDSLTRIQTEREQVEMKIEEFEFWRFYIKSR